MTELRVLQYMYRRNHEERHNCQSDKALRLVDVATVLKNSSALKFSKGSKYDIWSSKYIHIVLYY